MWHDSESSEPSPWHWGSARRACHSDQSGSHGSYGGGDQREGPGGGGYQEGCRGEDQRASGNGQRRNCVRYMQNLIYMMILFLFKGTKGDMLKKRMSREDRVEKRSITFQIEHYIVNH